MENNSNNITLTENFEMLKTLYEFQAAYPKTISFDEGEYFILHQTSTKQRNWWQVISIKGAIGFVPSNYVMKVQVEPSFLLEFLKSCISTLKASDEDDLNGIITRTELIEKLETKREQIEFSYHVFQEEDATVEPNLAEKTEDTVNKETNKTINNEIVINAQTPIEQNDNEINETVIKQSNTDENVNSTTKDIRIINSNDNIHSNSDDNSKTFQSIIMENGANNINNNTISTTVTKCDDINVSDKCIGYDTSITSEPSEATNTISEDEPTVLSNSDKNDSAQLTDLRDEQTDVIIIHTNQETTNENDAVENNTNDIENSVNNNNDNNNNNDLCSNTIPIIKENGITKPKVLDLSPVTIPIHSQPSSSSSSAVAAVGTTSVTAATATTTTAVSSHPSPPNATAIDVYQAIEAIRQTTDLSHELSCKALQVVLNELETMFPTKITGYLNAIAVHLTQTFSVPDEIIERTHDAQHLQLIFLQLADCKNDSQQRTWMLHEDESYIKHFLSQLIDILDKADKKIIQHVLKCDDYQSIINLIQYYQMEMRWPIKNLLIDAFKLLCYLDETVTDVLLTSVLPMELVQDIKSNSMNIDRLKDLCTMLTMIFSIGQCMPVNHQEHIDEDFVVYLLRMIEKPPEIDTSELLPDLMITLLLAFNLQFEDFTSNVVLNGIRTINSAKTLTEKILLLLNREEDPVKIFEYSNLPINSVLKLFIDLFSTIETASLFYTNDNKVLIDIIVRQLSDISAGDLRRRSYLELCRRILRNTNYIEHTHRKQDLMKIFTRIFCEETECSVKDQQLVRQIANEFPKIFKS